MPKKMTRSLSDELKDLAKQARADEQSAARTIKAYLDQRMQAVDDTAEKVFVRLREELRKKVKAAPHSKELALDIVSTDLPEAIQRKFHDAVVKLVMRRFKHEGLTVKEAPTTCWDEKSVNDYGENAAPGGCCTPINVTIE